MPLKKILTERLVPRIGEQVARTKAQVYSEATGPWSVSLSILRDESAFLPIETRSVSIPGHAPALSRHGRSIPMKPLLLVTGDIVLDCHLYGGVKTAAASSSEPGTTYTQHLGGAALTHLLLEASADADGRAWDKARDNWSKLNAERQEKSLPALPDDLPKDRPEPAFEVTLGLQTAGLESSLPGHLRSYGVWSDRPAKKGSDQRVWRVDRHFGYGPTESIQTGSIFNPVHPATEPVLTVIDDGGILFRQGSSRNAWPKLSTDGTTHFLLKMSSPLCRGDLWSELVEKQVMD